MFVVTFNNKIIYEYAGSQRLPGHQRLFLDQMDEDMDQGLGKSGALNEKPDSNQRLRFVVFKLIKGLDDDNQSLIRSTSVYLANRYPELSDIYVTGEGDNKKISLDFK